MKRLFCTLLSALLLLSLLSGCQKKEASITLDSDYVILCAEETGAVNQAAKSLQIALAQKWGLELELVNEAPAGKKTITVGVDEALSEGEYRTRIVDGNIAIEAQSAQVMTFAMRSIHQNWLSESSQPTLAADGLENLSGAVDLANAPFLVLTQNIRYADDEGGNKVVDRAPRYNKLVTEYMPDLIYIQEETFFWATIGEKFFEGIYGFSGTFSGGPETTKGSRNAIFYRLDRYEVLEEGIFWMSDTPDEPYTKLEASKGIRHCNWVLLKDNFTGRELLAVNVHLDTISNEVRAAQLDILYDRLGDKMEQYPTAFCGDFNARPDSGVYATMAERMSDPHVTAAVKNSTVEYTYDDYGTAENPGRLDYMFYNEFLTANVYEIKLDRYPDEKGSYISDHFGVTTEYSFAK